MAAALRSSLNRLVQAIETRAANEVVSAGRLFRTPDPIDAAIPPIAALLEQARGASFRPLSLTARP
jgi:hypothetical protein